jgi:S-adenosyl methyltransferase
VLTLWVGAVAGSGNNGKAQAVTDNRADDWLAREEQSAKIDTSVAHPARVYDYWLGGKDNFAADREAAEQVIAVRPTIIRDIRANRALLRRAVRYLAAEAGIRQFLDIGTGIPTSPNVHEVVQGVALDARVVYVDNDPIVLTYARALLTSTPEGATDYIDGDLRRPDEILRRAAETLDFTRPVAVVVVGTLHLISDDEDPYGIVARLVAATVPGSYLLISHPASDIEPDSVAEVVRQYNQRVTTSMNRRSRAEVARFFEGLDLVDPGIVQHHRWRPDPGERVDDYEVAGWSVLGRKP